MLRKTAYLLAECIDNIKAGRCSVESCMSKYPYIKNSLGPLLEVVSMVRTLRDIEPSSEYRERVRIKIMEQIYDRSEALAKKPLPRYFYKTTSAPLSGRIALKRLKIAALFIISIFVISAMGAGTIFASQDSLPGDMVYPVKIASEKVHLLSVRDSVDRVEIYLKWADNRIGEMKALNDKNNMEKIDIAIQGYNKDLDMAMENLEIDEAAELVALATTRQLAVLEEVFGKVPEQSQHAIKTAIEISKKGHEAAILALEKNKKDKGENIFPNKISVPEHIPDKAKNKVDNTSIEEGNDLPESSQKATDEAEGKAGEDEDIKEKDDFIDGLPVPENVKEKIKGVLK